MSGRYYGEVHNGTVILPSDCPLREGQRVRVEPAEEPTAAEASAARPLPLDESHPACGMWADRGEMADSVAYSRTVRESLTQRNRHG